jgi:hypothetical protein
MRASEVQGNVMQCPGCGKRMHFYGGSAGYICCDYKVLINQGGWFDDDGVHIKDDRLAGGLGALTAPFGGSNRTTGPSSRCVWRPASKPPVFITGAHPVTPAEQRMRPSCAPDAALPVLEGR